MEFYFTNRCPWCFCDSWYHLSAENFWEGFPKSILKKLKFENQCNRIEFWNCPFSFSKFFRKKTVLKKMMKIKALGNNQSNQLQNLFLAILRHCEDLLQKLTKLINFCINRLLNFWTQFFTFLNYFFWQIKQPSDRLFKQFSRSFFSISDCYYGMRGIWDIYMSLKYGMLHMYEAITIIYILLQVL